VPVPFFFFPHLKPNIRFSLIRFSMVAPCIILVRIGTGYNTTSDVAAGIAPSISCIVASEPDHRICIVA
jgi:hypothetical protein